MEIDRKKQAQALAEAKQKLSDAERQREEARVEAGVHALMSGSYDTLSNDELVENLPSYILNKHLSGEQEYAIKILSTLGEGLSDSEETIRERSLMILSVFSAIVLEERITDFQYVVSKVLTAWLEQEEAFIAGFEFICSQLEAMVLEMLGNEQWAELSYQISILEQIASGKIKKHNLIRGVASRVFENLADPDILDKLVSTYLEEHGNRKEQAQNLLIHFGRFAAMFLVQKMIYSTKKEDRFSLIELIPRVGEVSIPVLKQCLEDNPQWFVIRNIIFIISRLEDPDLYVMVEQYLDYPDIRVQQQAASCIEMLGGEHLKKRLISASLVVNDDLKGSLIDQLYQFSGQDVEETLISLLNKRHSYSPHVRDDLVLKLVRRLKQFPTARVASCFTDLVIERKEHYGDHDRILQEALRFMEEDEEALPGELESVVAGADHTEDQSAEDVSATDSVAASEKSEDGGDLLFSEAEMDELAGGDDSDGSFVETLEKDNGDTDNGVSRITPTSQDQHLTLWSNLYDSMSSDEANAFFTSLKTLTFKAGEKIVARGERDSRLFFIDGGFGSLSYHDTETSILLSSIHAGDLIGSEGLLDNLEWTLTLSAQTDLTVRVLEKEDYVAMGEKYPELAENIEVYCRHQDVLPHLIRNMDSDEDGPQNKRITVEAELFESEEEIGGIVQCNGQGGYSIVLTAVDSGAGESMLGRQVATDIAWDDGSEEKCFGVIAAAEDRPRELMGTPVYIKFYNPLKSDNYSCTAVTIM